MNGPAFLAYVEQVLAPTLKPGETVVMDNLPAHKVAGVRAAIEATGARMRLLPPYSPISTRSNSRLPSSKHCSAGPPHAPSPRSGTRSVTHRPNSRQVNAPTTSPLAAMSQNERNLL